MQAKELILTPNKRLTRYLQSQFGREISHAQNKTVWQTIKILPLDTWLITLWYETPDPRILLTSNQERILWQNIINHTSYKQHSELIESLIDLHTMIHGWQIDEATFSSYTTEDITSGQHLYTLFKKYCKKNKLITNSELLTVFLPYLSDFKFTKITFAGFDTYTPQLQKFITSLEQTGCSIKKIDPNQQKANHKLIALNNLKQELTTSANWAKQLLSQNPHHKIGIVVPNLVTMRSYVNDVFMEVFGNDKNINISAGISLNTLPIINCAYELLALEQPFAITTITQLLLSPYIAGAATEKTARILFNQQLQQTQLLPLSLTTITHLAQKYKANIPTILQTLHNWQTNCLSITKKQFNLYAWSEIFTQTLQLWGWPGEHHLNISETTAIKTLEHTLQEIATMSIFINKISQQQALKTVRILIANTMIQTQPEFDAPINIVGTLEATGINFDYLWIMGQDEEHWPSKPQPNPFIPHTIQKKHSLPHSSYEREYQFCNTLLQRYKRSAKEIIFSYPKQITDKLVGPSALVASSPPTTIQELNLTPTQTSATKVYTTKTTETITDTQAPILQPNEIAHATSRLVELQALCPFRAFAQLRLHIQEPLIPTLGINKQNRGIIVHQVLEKFWNQTKTQANLCALSITELTNILTHQIKQSLTKLDPIKILAQLETQRLTVLLLNWLEIEKQRAAFQVIATEKPAIIKLASLPLHLRIDRIDQLTDGKKIIMDYKTGKNLPIVYDWFSARPKNLQLPLYSLAIDSVSGLCLAQINSENLKCKTIELSDLLSILHKIDPQPETNNIKTWEKLITNWRIMLEKLVADFAAGKADVNPISSRTCTKCNCAPICRVSL